MGQFSLNISVDAPKEEVFRIFTDFENAPKRVRGISKLEVLTDGPVGVGTRFRETREMFKREATEEMEITQLTPGESYTVGCETCGCEYATVFRFTPTRSGTDVEMQMTTRAISLFAKIMSPIMSLMMGPMMRKCMMQDMADLKAAAEGKPVDTDGSAANDA